MTSELRPAGKTILSCGHEDIDGCLGVSVQFDDEDCVAGEGFIPVTVYAQYCHDCAKTLYYELGKDTGRVEAGLVQEEQAAELAKFKTLAETLAKAGEDLKADMIRRAEWAAARRKDDDIVVEAGAGVWFRFNEALREYKEARDD